MFGNLISLGEKFNVWTNLLSQYVTLYTSYQKRSWSRPNVNRRVNNHLVRVSGLILIAILKFTFLLYHYTCMLKDLLLILLRVQKWIFQQFLFYFDFFLFFFSLHRVTHSTLITFSQNTILIIARYT